MNPSDPHLTTNSNYLTGFSGSAQSPNGFRVGALALAMQALLCPAIFGQSAANFEPQKISTEATAPKPAPSETKDSAPAPAKEVVATNSGPSRYVNEVDQKPYVASLSSLFSMKTRTIDPFGQYQDPDAKPITKPKLQKRTRRAAPTRVTPFADIIDRIKITTIMPGQRRFLVGTRSFKEGDRFPLNFRDRVIKVEVAKVTARQVDFRSLEDGETAALTLKLLPVGMTPGNGKITAPGMVRDTPNSPLEIEPSN